METNYRQLGTTYIYIGTKQLQFSVNHTAIIGLHTQVNKK